MTEDTPTPAPEEPEFGPRGYLPPRASKRARKIVLRAPMSLAWVIAPLVIGVILLIVGWIYFLG